MSQLASHSNKQPTLKNKTIRSLKTTASTETRSQRQTKTLALRSKMPHSEKTTRSCINKKSSCRSFRKRLRTKRTPIHSKIHQKLRPMSRSRGTRCLNPNSLLNKKSQSRLAASTWCLLFQKSRNKRWLMKSWHSSTSSKFTKTI